MPAVGDAKARRIEELLHPLLPEDATSTPTLQPQLQQIAAGLTFVPAAGVAARSHALDGNCGDNCATAPPAVTTAANDWQALQAWIQAKAGHPEDPRFSTATAKAYRIEGERLLL